ncbi:Na+/H+ antiporter NhaA [Pontimonas sp.]|nr:Na+/H+ antiporter NhaA [Pontimonas sp.]
MAQSRPPSGSLANSKYREALWIERILRQETIGGLIIVGAALIAVVLANSPLGEDYFGLRETYITLGFGELAWKISVGKFTADGLLAIFFFLVGLELKREFVSGELRDPRKALVPVVAAIGGVLVPAGLYLFIVNSMGEPDAARGWAIPIATDIAFALAVLALVGSWLPLALRTFLLTLAVVDDLIGITIIAVVYTDEVVLGNLGLSIAFVVLYGVVAQRYTDLFHIRPGAAWVILVPLGLVAWFFMYGSGVHATIAGVLLAMTVPVLRPKKERIACPDSKEEGLAEVFEHRFRPLSAGIAVPLFAFFAAGVSLGNGEQTFWYLLTQPVSVAIIASLVIGKPVGVLIATWLVTRVPGVSMPKGMAWIDLLGIALLAGIGFTVSLLIGELSFGVGNLLGDEAKIGILFGSILAALLAALVLFGRNRHYRQMRAEEQADRDRDGVPDIYQDADDTQS